MKNKEKLTQKVKDTRIEYPKFSMRVYIILLIVAEVGIISLIAPGVTKLLTYFGIATVIPELVWILLIGIVLGAAVSVLVSYFIFRPIAKLGRAMRQVSEGNFDVRMPLNSPFREIREIYLNFNRMVEELGNTETLQTDFVSNVSHEFKTPISAIEGYATLLQAEGSEIDKMDRTEYVDKILRNTKRLSSLVGNILLLSKVDHQAIPKGSVRFRLDEQIRQALLLLEPEWTKKDLEFDVEMEELEYQSNETLLHHVWYNLIGNAIKFSPERGIIRIVLSKESDAVQFVIEDHGPGIPEDVQKHIFNRFYQGDSSHKEEGNGLGLALVRQILLGMQGSVSVENLSGQGSRFTVKLPPILLELPGRRESL